MASTRPCFSSTTLVMPSKDLRRRLAVVTICAPLVDWCVGDVADRRGGPAPNFRAVARLDFFVDCAPVAVVGQHPVVEPNVVIVLGDEAVVGDAPLREIAALPGGALGGEVGVVDERRIPAGARDLN